MTQLSWLQSYSFMVGVILCWSPNGRTGFAAAAGKGWMNGRISALSSTRGRTALGLPSFVTRRNRYYYYSSYHQRRANPTTTISTPGLVDQLRGGGDQGYGQDSYYQTEDASPFDESQPPPQDDPYYATSQQRRRRRYNNVEDEAYYGEQPDDRYSYYDNNESYYDDRGRPPPRSSAFSSSSSSNSLLQQLQHKVQNGDQKIGIILLSSGLFFTMMGIFLFFQKALMRLGNLLFIAGVPMTIGPGRTAGYFFQPKKARATGCLAVGIFLVFIGMPVVGMILEVFGLLNLFANMFPVIFAVVKQMPIVGTVFQSNNNNNNNNKSYNRSRDRYYDDDRGNQYYDDPIYNSNEEQGDDDNYQGADRYY